MMRSYKNKVMMIFFLMSLIPSLILSVVLYELFRNQLIRELNAHIQTYTNVVVNQLDYFIEERSFDARLYSQLPLIYEPVTIYDTKGLNYNDEEWTQITKELDRSVSLLLERHQLHSLFIVDNNSKMIYDANPLKPIPLGTDMGEIGRQIGNEEALLEAKNGMQAWSKYLYAPSIDSMIMLVITPIYSNSFDNKIVGALYMSMGQEKLDRIMSENLASLHEEAQVYLVNKDGYLKTNLNNMDFEDFDFLEYQVSNPLIEKFHRNESTELFRSNDIYTNTSKQKVLGTITSIQLGRERHGLVVEVPYFTVMKPVITFSILLFIIISVFLLLLSIIGYQLAKTIIRPIHRIIQWTNQLAMGDYSIQTPFEHHQEFIALEESIGQMAKQISERESELIAHNEELEASYQQLSAFSSEITRLNDELEHLAYHDVLTDLPNRRLFLKLIDEAILREEGGILILIDFDNFKEINDIHGHLFGDKILVEISERIKKIATKYPSIETGRYGGDEFLLFQNQHTFEIHVKDLLTYIHTILSAPYDIYNLNVPITYSMGITIMPQDGNEALNLIANADMAMYEAKKYSGSSYTYYKSHMHATLKQQNQIKQLLTQALTYDGFELVFQPQVNLRENSIHGYEALLRLKDRSLGPNVFIPIAERSDIIIHIGRWVTTEVFRQIHKWQHEGFQHGYISINFSGKQLEDSGYIDLLKELLREYDVLPEMIEIELTEGMFLEKDEKAIRFVNDLKSLGIRIALDDFGAGYASLHYLTYLPLDMIKFDCEFTQYFLKNNCSNTIEQLISLFHSMGLDVLCEGIEEYKDVQVLKQFGCDLIQGYFYSPPISKDKVPLLVIPLP